MKPMGLGSLKAHDSQLHLKRLRILVLKKSIKKKLVLNIEVSKINFIHTFWIWGARVKVIYTNSMNKTWQPKINLGTYP